jgi:26S proteasome regulatory subunit N5
VVQVETFGAMEKREKAEFLLEQVRLCLSQRDFVRMQIIANKVNKRVLDEEGFEVW